MYICFDDETCNNLISIKLLKEYLEENKNLNIGIVYKRKENTFEDLNGNPISIEAKKIIPHTGVYECESLIEAIRKHKGISLISEEDLVRTSHWINAYKTKRRTQIVTGEQLLDSSFIEYIENYYGKEIFFKTVNKDYSSFLNIDFLKDHESLIVRALKHHLKDQFIISEKMEILEDELGPLEYRCFVINKKIISISRLTDHAMHRIDTKVLEEIQKVIDLVDYENFPNSFVVDLCECKGNDGNFFDVVEFNGLCSSGTYLYNSLLPFETSNILHDDITCIAPEKQKYASKLIREGKYGLVPSKTFEKPGSFANDLKNIRLKGSAGGYFSIYGAKFDNNEIKDEVLGMHGSLFGDMLKQVSYVDSEAHLKHMDEELMETSKGSSKQKK